MSQPDGDGALVGGASLEPAVLLYNQELDLRKNYGFYHCAFDPGDGAG